MKSSRFTIIEILAVIAIIVILAGILVPTAGSVIKKAKISKTKAAIHSLHLAIKQYETSYGYLPLTPTTTADTTLDASQYAKLLKTLAVWPDPQLPDVPKPGDDTTPNSALNSRLIQFLQVKEDSNQHFYRDAWNNDFVVVLDLNHDRSLGSSVILDFDDPGISLTTSIAISSRGPDGEPSNWTVASDTDPENEDNINSWD